MKVLRKQETETSNIQMGDQIIIQLTGFGEFTATAQKITDKGTLFLFDDCVAEQPMNKKPTNEGAYEKSDLYKWINTVLLSAFPEDVRTRIDNLTIPTYGQMFGHNAWYALSIKPDGDEQLPLMKERKNRIADFNGNYEWYWMQNTMKSYLGQHLKEVATFNFTYVDDRGYTSGIDASNSYGVRPVFLLVD